MGDPLITHDDGTPLTAEEISDVMVDAVLKAGVHPAHAYAIKKTGFIVTAMNVDEFDDEDIEDWNAAVAEGESIHGAVPSY